MPDKPKAKTASQKREGALPSPSYFERLFTGRIGRMSYLVGYLLFSIGIPLAVGIVSAILAATGLGAIFIIFMLAALITLAFYGVSLSVRRFHDIGKSGWWVLWLVAPFVNIYFIFVLFLKRGEEEANEYGAPPDSKVNVGRLVGITG